MRRRFTIVVLLAASVVLASPATAGAGEAGDGGGRGKVLIVSYPGLGWQEVIDTAPPVLTALLAESSVASLSVRTIGPVTTPGEAYATIGAGNRATVEDSVAGLAFPPTAAFEGDEAGEVFARRCGCVTGAPATVHLGIPQVARFNERLLFGASVGSLGQALTDGGITTAVVANADRAMVAVGTDVHREASLALVDSDGRVQRGSVGTQLLAEDPRAPFGVRMDTDTVVATIEGAWTEADVMLVEMSDLDRAEYYRDVATPEAVAMARSRALMASDDVLTAALAGVDPDHDLVIVLGPSSRRHERAGLTVVGLRGPGFDAGLARSAATRRAGYLALTDISPSVLDALDAEIPEEMNGTLASSVPSDQSPSERFEELAEVNEVAQFRDRATGPASVAFIVFQVLVYGLAVAALSVWPRLRGPVMFLALITLAQPSLAFLSGLGPYRVLGVGGYVAALFAGGALLAALALGVARASAQWSGRARPLVAPLLLVGATLSVLVVDVATGAHLQINTVFGYSPTVAGRFAGFGNLAFALLGVAAVVVVTGAFGLVALRRGRRFPSRRRLALSLVGAALAMVVIIAGAPSLGSDVGGVLALVPASVAVVVVLGGRRFDAWRFALAGLGAVVVIAGLAALDLARPDTARTHLGRFAERIIDGGPGSVATVLVRKLDANLSILTSSVWTYVIPVAVAFLVFLVVRRDGFLRSLEHEVPGLRACLVGTLVVGVLGFAVNDSGIAIPAMMLAVLLPYLTVLIVATAKGSP